MSRCLPSCCFPLYLICAEQHHFGGYAARALSSGRAAEFGVLLLWNQPAGCHIDILAMIIRSIRIEPPAYFVTCGKNECVLLGACRQT